jgi:hypothetical protein
MEFIVWVETGSSSNSGVTQLDLDLGTTNTIFEDTFRPVVQDRTACRMKRLKRGRGSSPPPTLQN